MGQQLVDAAAQTNGQLCPHILGVSPRIVAIELGRHHQTHHHGGSLAGQFAATEEPGLVKFI